MISHLISLMGTGTGILLLAGQASAGGISSGSMPPAPCENGIGRGYVTGYQKIDARHSCPMYAHTCVVDDERCPKPTPPSPGFCPDGQIMSIPRFLSVGGRDSCELPEIACVRVDLCPQYAPLPPSFCPDGRIQTRMTGFFRVQGRYSCPAYEAVCVSDELCARP